MRAPSIQFFSLSLILVFFFQGVLYSSSAPDFTPEELKRVQKQIEISDLINQLNNAERFQWTGLIPELLKQLEALDPELPDLQYFHGLESYRNDEKARAAILFKKAVEKDPSFDAAWNMMGLLRMEAGRLPEAENAFRKAVLSSPYNPSYVYNLSNVLYRLGKLNEAILFGRMAVEFKPNFADAHYLDAIIQRDQGRPAEALESFSLAKKFGMNNESFLKEFLILTNREEKDEISLDLCEALADSKDPEILRIHSRLRIKYAEFPAAFRILEQLLQTGSASTEDRKYFLLSARKSGMDPIPLLESMNLESSEKESLENYLMELDQHPDAPGVKDPIMKPIQ